MSEYFHVEKPFLDQLATLGWTVIDQGHGLIPSDPTISLRENFREWLLPEVFRTSVRALNLTSDGRACQKEKGTGRKRGHRRKRGQAALFRALRGRP